MKSGDGQSLRHRIFAGYNTITHIVGTIEKLLWVTITHRLHGIETTNTFLLRAVPFCISHAYHSAAKKPVFLGHTGENKKMQKTNVFYKLKTTAFIGGFY